MSDAFSLPRLRPAVLSASLEANNVTFNVCFLVLFVYTFQIGLAALWMPLAFVLSLLLYAFVFLPQQVNVLRVTGKLSEWLGQGQKRWVSASVLGLVQLNFAAYAALEIQGFRWFAQSSTGSGWGAEALVILLLGGILCYLWPRGLAGSVQTDRWQLGLIYLGVAVLWFCAWPELLKFPLPVWQDLFLHPLFAIQMLLGFACVQLLYAENWLRLHAFLIQPEAPPPEQHVLKTLQGIFIRTAVGNLWVLTTPVLLGLLAHQHWPDADPLRAFIQVLHLLSASGPNWLGWVVIAMAMAAIASTLDTFAMTWAAGWRVSWRLSLVLFLGVAYGLSFVPLTLTSFYVLVSFLLNLLVGPILWQLYRSSSFPPLRFGLNLGWGVLLTILSLFLGGAEWLGCLLLGSSLLLCLWP